MSSNSCAELKRLTLMLRSPIKSRSVAEVVIEVHKAYSAVRSALDALPERLIHKIIGLDAPSCAHHRSTGDSGDMSSPCGMEGSETWAVLRPDWTRSVGESSSPRKNKKSSFSPIDKVEKDCAFRQRFIRCKFWGVSSILDIKGVCSLSYRNHAN